MQQQTYTYAQCSPLANRDEVEEWMPQTKAKTCQKVNKHRWTVKENKIYIQYLKRNKDKFKDKESRKKGKVFLRLAKQIRKRTYEQVKSHHQKMIIKYKTIQSIIVEFEANFILDLSMEENLTVSEKRQSTQSQDQCLELIQSPIIHNFKYTELGSQKVGEQTWNYEWEAQSSRDFLEWFSDL